MLLIKSNFQNLFFHIFWLSTLFGGNWLIGRFSLSFYAIVLMAMNFIIILPKKFSLPYKDIKLYFLYVIVLFYVSLFNGDMANSSNGFVSLFMNYVGCFLIYFSIDYYIKDRKQIFFIVKILIFLISINALASHMQFINNPIGWGIWKIFNNGELNFVELVTEYVDKNDVDTNLGLSFSAGIFPSPVTNGYYFAALGLLPLYYVANTIYSFRVRLFNLFLFMSFFISLFEIQQRSAFFLFIIAFLVVLIIMNMRRWIYIGGILFCVLFVWLGIDDLDWGRIGELDLGGRSSLYSTGWHFVESHWFLGGRFTFLQMSDKSVHNLILNGIIYSGIIGLIIILIIFVRMLIKAVKIIIDSKRTITMSIYTILAISLLVYNFMSFTHNTSLITGDLVIWFLYALMLKSYIIYTEK